MIIDTHAHYDDRYFGDDISVLMSEMKQNGVDKILTCSINLQNSEEVISLCEQYDMLYAAVGIYPHETNKYEFDREKLINLTKHKKVVAIGEIGLDYYYDGSPKETQIDIVSKQIEIANELDLPISFHDREAHQNTMEILKKYKPKGVVHCFSGSVEMAREIIKLGMYIGIGGALTFKKARVLPEVVKEIPLDKIVLETDAPYMAPAPYRGKQNRSDYIRFIAEKVAEIKEIPVEQVYNVTNQNAKDIFKF